MQLINHTHWRTDHLQAIIDRVALKELSPQQRKTMVIHLTYGSRRSGSSGHTWAWVRGTGTLQTVMHKGKASALHGPPLRLIPGRGPRGLRVHGGP